MAAQFVVGVELEEPGKRCAMWCNVSLQAWNNTKSIPAKERQDTDQCHMMASACHIALETYMSTQAAGLGVGATTLQGPGRKPGQLGWEEAQGEQQGTDRPGCLSLGE